MSPTEQNDRVHAALNERLISHRLRVMDRDAAGAQRTWDQFAALLEQHIADEEEHVLPHWVERCAEVPAERGGAPDIVERDHDKLKAHLREIGSLVGQLDPTARPERFLELLDREKIVADLLEHHDLRERLVYPPLETELAPRVASDIARRLAASLDAA